MTNYEQLQAVITAKCELLATITSQLADMMVSPKPDYQIDGQSVSWVGYQRYLIDAQRAEGEAIEQLTKTLNLLQPYQFVSRGC